MPSQGRGAHAMALRIFIIIGGNVLVLPYNSSFCSVHGDGDELLERALSFTSRGERQAGILMTSLEVYHAAGRRGMLAL